MTGQVVRTRPPPLVIIASFCSPALAQAPIHTHDGREWETHQPTARVLHACAGGGRRSGRRSACARVSRQARLAHSLLHQPRRKMRAHHHHQLLPCRRRRRQTGPPCLRLERGDRHATRRHAAEAPIIPVLASRSTETCCCLSQIRSTYYTVQCLLRDKCTHMWGESRLDLAME